MVMDLTKIVQFSMHFECGTIKGPVCVTLMHYTTTQALQCTKEAKDPEKTGREGNATNFHLHTHTHT